MGPGPTPPGDTPTPDTKVANALSTFGSTPRRWSCLHCSWVSSRVPDTVVVLWHKCRPDGVRRQVVALPTITTYDPSVILEDARRDWFTSLYPVPPSPVGVREPRPTTPRRPRRPPR